MTTMHGSTSAPATPEPTALASRRRLGDWLLRRLGWLRILVGLLPLAVLLGAWQLLGSPDSFSFPAPSAWVDAARSLHDSGELGSAAGRTLATFALGTGASILVGIAVGWLIGSSALANRALGPILEIFRSTPAPAIVPLATILFGVTLSMSIVVMVTAVAWPVLLNTAASRRTIPPVRLEMARVMGLRWDERMRKVVFPSLVPDIMIGVRVAVSLGFVVSLLVDIIGSGAGLGRLLVVRQQSFDAASVWAILVVIGVFGLIVNGLAAALEKRIVRGR